VKRLLIYAAASGRYRNYIDMWKVFIETAYPECGVYVREVTDDELKGKQRYYAACIGYVEKPPIADGYEYFFITDIDVMICQENPNLMESRLNDLIGCYSNTRRDQDFTGEIGRLTAPHFFHSSWWDKTREARNHFKHELESGTIGRNLWDNEVILYKLAKLSGLKIPPVGDPFKYHCGIHLGNQRNIEGFNEEHKRRYMLAHISREWSVEWRRTSKMRGYVKAKEAMRLKDRQAYTEVVTVEKYVDMILSKKG
jgi:hypothetical protein